MKSFGVCVCGKRSSIRGPRFWAAWCCWTLARCLASTSVQEGSLPVRSSAAGGGKLGVLGGFPCLGWFFSGCWDWFGGLGLFFGRKNWWSRHFSGNLFSFEKGETISFLQPFNLRNLEKLWKFHVCLWILVCFKHHSGLKYPSNITVTVYHLGLQVVMFMREIGAALLNFWMVCRFLMCVQLGAAFQVTQSIVCWLPWKRRALGSLFDFLINFLGFEGNSSLSFRSLSIQRCFVEARLRWSWKFEWWPLGRFGSLSRWRVGFRMFSFGGQKTTGWCRWFEDFEVWRLFFLWMS